MSTRKPGEITDRAGRTWRIENYQSPSGPAFSITLPPQLDPEFAAGFTAHFDGQLTYEPRESLPVRDRQGVQFGDGNTQLNNFGARW